MPNGSSLTSAITLWFAAIMYHTVQLYNNSATNVAAPQMGMSFIRLLTLSNIYQD